MSAHPFATGFKFSYLKKAMHEFNLLIVKAYLQKHN